MIVEYGHFALILAFGVSLMQAVMPWLQSLSVHSQWVLVRASAVMQCALVSLAFVTLLWAFYSNDLSVVYVVNHSHDLLPVHYRLAALWGGHEGSFLLWALLLSVWTVLVAYAGRSLPAGYQTKVLAILGMISAGFLLFMLSTSNPFARYLPWLPQQGQDLNPLLQDPGLVIHPPMLYAGYVGFAVAFAFAMAALWEKRLDQAWAAWVRPWTLLAWCCLTYGIVLGSWWAYRELGWGGWWFWDPVENASLMPWLVGTALLHSLMTVHRHNHFKVWTICLAIMAFSLSLLGTFLVRSGVLVSVHAFAVDPERGIFMLLYLLLVVGGALAVFAWRAPYLLQRQAVPAGTKGHFLWLNNICLAVMLLTVLLGTLYPIAYQALGWGKLSVGAPYFNQVMVLLAGPFFIIMAIGPHATWQKPVAASRWRHLGLLGGGVLLLALLCLVGWQVPWRMVWGGALALWIIVSLLMLWWQAWRSAAVKTLSLARAAMMLAHLGVAVFILGVSVSSSYGLHRDVVLATGDQFDLGAYQLRLVGMQSVHGVNYDATQADVALLYKGRQNAMLHPQQRVYTVSGMDLAKTAIHAGVFSDIYVALGQVQQDGRWSFRAYYKPLVRWIWAGGVMMMVGALCAMLALWRAQRRVKP